MLKIIIQELPIQDWHKAAIIHQHCFPDGWTEKSIHNIMSISGTKIWGVFIPTKMELIGICIFHQNIDFIDIFTICIIPIWQRKGISMQIFDNIFAFCAKESIDKVILEVQESNDAAFKLYKKLGFEKIIIKSNYYGLNKHAVVMVKKLINN